MKLLIRPAAEVAIKSKPVRQQQMRQLRQNIRKLLKRVDEDVRVEGSWDRVDIDVPDGRGLYSPVLDELLRIPGISTIQEVNVYPLQSLEDIGEKAVAAYAGRLEGKTLAVRAKRVGKHDFRSLDIERSVGAALLRAYDTAGVDLKSPDVEVRVEVNNDSFHIATRKHQGMGGYPVGTVDTVMTLISGGYDSSVAAYLMMRRGLRNHYLFFNLGGTAHEVGVRQVAHYLWQRYGASHSVKFISVPFDGVVAEIMRSVNNRHWGVVLKRQMLKAASEIAETLNVSGLVMGDAVAQVSSQTLQNLNVVDRACEQVVLRPLIAMDKQEIIRIAHDIGTESFARNMPEYCGVISQRPATRAKLHRVEEDEAKMDPQALAKAIENREETGINRLLDTTVTPEEVELVQTPAVDDVVIDVRHPSEEERAPLTLTNNEILKIPFYELNQQFEGLAPDRQYLLYCDRGTMSQMHAGHLKAEGHGNVKVYAPAG
ncbi:tRNA uracil 4-sulfurtransferase ThiI [Marinobacter persicus]|uniref:tRNA sulfurtransferase n=1 Tax=Marinobacter persicus TaxID=930118 RepID=A0A2S6G8L4_9GAMM|nr:tRNA uracil 4-sulfurtransferase ThiI [Marinobacter persicus]PPK52592.1 [ThiS-adenylate] sulfurtransferase [Marinobacter persicus]PPK55565.1 [ThiS-adenylate] sulfurtransferase [Marinobacter persicus]PPK58445.1 [ThiS-adenylate] sulfurtransferase [Marinobacter persicus]